jgi:hypothetical protein
MFTRRIASSLLTGFVFAVAALGACASDTGNLGLAGAGAPPTSSGGAQAVAVAGRLATPPSAGRDSGPATSSGVAGRSGSAGAPAADGGGPGAPAAGGSGAVGGSAVAPGAGAGGAGPAADGGRGGSCDPSCAEPANGLPIGCKKRFMFGVNYAWIDFGEDFGGGAKGVAAKQPAVLSALQEMKASGVNVVRWWMHPVFFNDGVTFDPSGTPTGLGGSELADIEAALALAAQAGVFIKLTPFSFDNFRGDDRAGHGLTAIVSDATKRAALIENVVRPIARAVAASANSARMISWDVINEPEWAIMGDDGHGDEPFDPNPELMAVPFPVMETFVGDVVKGLRAESQAPITVGQAAIKWARAFTQVGLDYYDMHYYGWVDQYFPIGAKSLAEYGIGDKPVVVGEFPLDGWTNPNGTFDAKQIIDKLYAAGYSGAKAWAYTQDGGWANNKGNLDAFAKSKGCEVEF